MEYQYTINQIATKCGVSITSINNLKKKNQELINANSTRRQRKIYYNQAAMDFFVSYYQANDKPEEKEDPAVIDEDQEEGRARGNNSPTETPSEDEPHESQTNTTKAEIDAMRAQIDDLKKELELKELERRELFRQNAALLLMLQQEKQEKQLFLPTPKKSFSEKVKSFFNRGKAQEN